MNATHVNVLSGLIYPIRDGASPNIWAPHTLIVQLFICLLSSYLSKASGRWWICQERWQTIVLSENFFLQAQNIASHRTSSWPFEIKWETISCLCAVFSNVDSAEKNNLWSDSVSNYQYYAYVRRKHELGFESRRKGHNAQKLSCTERLKPFQPSNEWLVW